MGQRTQVEIELLQRALADGDAGLASHLADAIAAHAATAISFSPAGGVAAVTVQAAIAELDTEKAGTAHGHVAADVSDFSAAADARIALHVAAGDPHTQYASDTDLSNHLSDAVDAHDASAISFSPTGAIAATDVQAAIAELDTEKSASGHGHSNFSDVAPGFAPLSGGGTSNFLRADGTWAAPPAGGTNLAYTASTRLLESSTGSDVTLPLVTSTDAGLAPLSGGGTTNFLRADGSWAAPPGGSGTDLSYTAATRLLASSTGADVTLPLVTSTDAGLAPLSGGGTANFLRADGSWAAPTGTATNLAYTAATRLLESSTGTDVTLPLVASADAGLAPASGGGTTNFLRADGTWAAPTGAPTDLAYTPSTRLLASSTGTDVTLPLVTSTEAGFAPLSGGGTSNFLRADGTWAAPTGAATDLAYTASTRLLASSTGADVTLPLVASADAGLAPASGGGTANFLRADGTWAAPVAVAGDISYAPGSFTVLTGTQRIGPYRLTMTTTQRITVAGTGRLSCKN